MGSFVSFFGNIGNILEQGLGWLNDNILWGIPMLVLLLGCHIFFTFRLGIQRYIFKGIKATFTKDKNSGDVSAWGALATALGATIGTGNIVGVALAIGLGGPGALFWCWITGVFGIATKYAEALVAVKYRVKTEEGMLGGAMTALEHGLKCKWGGVLFATFTALATFGIGCSIQANSISTLVEEVSGGSVPLWITGIILTSMTFIVIIGGVRSISKVCMWLVPIMAITYILSCLLLLILGYKTLPHTVSVILTEAFSPKALAGGICGSALLTAMRWGVSRGLFSNESGMGSAPLVDAASKTPNSVKQALVASTGTFWDTVICCLITGLVIVNTGAYDPALGLKGASITNYAFSHLPKVFGVGIGSYILTFGLFTFAYSTILGWSYYGEAGIRYLFGKKGILPYRIVYTLVVFAGAVLSLDLVWTIGDTLNAFMIIPNIICILLLTPIIVKETKKYLYSDKLYDVDEDIQ